LLKRHKPDALLNKVLLAFIKQRFILISIAAHNREIAMKLTFEREDIEAILLAKAREMGIECNTVRIDSLYGTATVSNTKVAEVVELERAA
jgi:tRNA A-37 threonylcarbamoyl transferase component Bud32